MNSIMKSVLAVVCAAMLFTSATAAEIGTVNVDVLNVRQTASLQAPILGQLKINTPVSVFGTQDGWSRISYFGNEAYVLSQYIHVQFLEDGTTYLYEEPKYGLVNTDVLNVRAAASFETEVSGVLYRNQKLELLGESGAFYLVQIGDAIRFVAKDYVQEVTYETYQQASMGSEVISAAMQYIGTPYRYGGSSPSGFDCSGFTSYVYAKMGVSLNRTAGGQLQNGYYVSLEEMQPGDLVFFGNSSYISHVGIYVGNGNMIHAPYSGRSVCVESIYNGYFGSRLYGARRIF